MMKYRISYFPLTPSFPHTDSGGIPQSVEDYDSIDDAIIRFRELDFKNTTVNLQITNNA